MTMASLSLDALPTVSGKASRCRQGALPWWTLEMGGGPRGRAEVPSGQGIVNIEFFLTQEGEEKFPGQNANPLLCSIRPALVVMAFERQGQAATNEEKIPIWRTLLSNPRRPSRFSVSRRSIIFDPNILTVATGMDEHNNYAVIFINATRLD